MPFSRGSSNPGIKRASLTSLALAGRFFATSSLPLPPPGKPIYKHTYVCIYIYVCVYMYIYIYIYIQLFFKKLVIKF